MSSLLTAPRTIPCCAEANLTRQHPSSIAALSSTLLWSMVATLLV